MAFRTADGQMHVAAVQPQITFQLRPFHATPAYGRSWNAICGCGAREERLSVMGSGKGIGTVMTRSEFVRTLEETLGVPSGGLQPSDTRDTVGGWSSLTDVTILTILFSEFGLEAEDELLEYRSVGDLLAILDGHRVFADS
jgi:acyl carrier protein